MKRAVFGVLLALFVATAAWGQVFQVDQISWQGRVPSLASGVTAQTTGLRGSVYIYYWVTARYPRGVTAPAGPARAVNTVGIAALGAPSAVRISWQPAPGATGYDVIRLAVPQFPTNGTCVNCVVSSNQAATTFLDVGGAVVNWPTAGTVAAGGGNISAQVNNRDQSAAYLQFSTDPHFAPTRGTNEYSYGWDINGGTQFFRQTGVQKSYLLTVRGDRPLGFAATGDSNDALIRATYNNYALNDANFIIRGINTITNNRTGGTLGILEGGLISTANRGTGPIVRGLSVGVENYGVTATEFGGVDVNLRNEGAVATLEYGVKVRNTNNSLATAVESAYLVADTGANIGFNFGLNLNGATIQTGDIKLHNQGLIMNSAIDNLNLRGVTGQNWYVDTVNETGAVINRATQYFTGADGPDFAARHARGTIAAPVILNAADEIGSWRANGWDGTAFVGGAEITAIVDAAPGVGDMPGALVISTANDGAMAMTERVRFSSTGGMTINGVAFGALGAPAAGTIVYCNNCDPSIAGAGPTVCSTGGASSGALAIRLNGAWTCLGI